MTNWSPVAITDHRTRLHSSFCSGQPATVPLDESIEAAAQGPAGSHLCLPFTLFGATGSGGKATWCLVVHCEPGKPEIGFTAPIFPSLEFLSLVTNAFWKVNNGFQNSTPDPTQWTIYGRSHFPASREKKKGGEGSYGTRIPSCTLAAGRFP